MKSRKGKLKMARPMPIVVATTASSSKNGDPQQELTTHGTYSNASSPSK
jgi:hypothetical protein